MARHTDSLTHSPTLSPSRRAGEVAGRWRVRPPIRQAAFCGIIWLSMAALLVAGSTALVAGSTALVPGSTAAEPPLERFEHSFPAMGVEFSLAFYARDASQGTRAMLTATTTVRHLDRVLSDYREDSEARRLTARADQAPVPVSDDLWRVLDRSLHWSRATGGAFDVTVGPLSEVWRQARRSGRLPDPVELEDARRRVGWRQLELAEGQRVTLAPGVQLDFGGIGKGYAADRVLEELAQLNITRALVSAGGDLAIGDPPPGQPGWQVTLETGHQGADTSRRAVGVNPLFLPTLETSHRDDQRDDPADEVLLLTGVGVATSGDAAQALVVDGRRYSHIVDPHTGQALTDSRVVAVIAGNATNADALASALSVLGVERGLALATELDGVEAAFLALDLESRQVVGRWTTDGWPRARIP